MQFDEFNNTISLEEDKSTTLAALATRRNSNNVGSFSSCQ